MTTATVSVVEEQPLRYVLSVPPPPVEAPVPVLCFLHGYGEGPPLEIRAAVGKHGPLWSGAARAASERFLVVAPQLPRRGDIWHEYADAVYDIVRDIQQRYGGEPYQTYLTGFSFGGNGVFDLALKQRNFWAALWVVDPTRVPPEDPGRPVWLSIGEAARHQTREYVHALKLQPVGMTLDGDRYHLDQAQDHVGSARLAYGDAAIYDWLLSKRLVVSPS